MVDIVKAILDNVDAFRWLFFLGVLLAFYNWMQGEDSKGIEWRDFISARGADGQYHGDINKLGQSTGIVIGSIALVLVSSAAKDDMTGFAAVLLAYFAFVGGAAGYAAYLRSKVSQTQTTTIVEPVAEPGLVKTTKTVLKPATKGKGK